MSFSWKTESPNIRHLSPRQRATHPGSCSTKTRNRYNCFLRKYTTTRRWGSKFKRTGAQIQAHHEARKPSLFFLLPLLAFYLVQTKDTHTFFPLPLQKKNAPKNDTDDPHQSQKFATLAVPIFASADTRKGKQEKRTHVNTIPGAHNVFQKAFLVSPRFRKKHDYY